MLSNLATAIQHNWPIWLVTVVLIVAAVIDGIQLKVPNWITFPMIITGWAFSYFNPDCPGLEGLGWSLLGTVVGLALLMPLYAIGGMGAGDVKLLAGVGAWVGVAVTFYAFCLTALIGGGIAILMVLWQKGWQKHRDQFLMIFSEVMTVGNPSQLAAMAAERKSSMLLLPYGIPIAIGCIVYFAWTGMLV